MIVLTNYILENFFPTLVYDKVWKGNTDIIVCDKKINISLAVYGDKNTPVTEEQRNTYYNALEVLKKYNLYKSKLLNYIKNDSKKHFENIFDIITPKTLLITYDNRFGVLCDYKYDKEHGLAIYSTSKGNINVGPQDDIL